MLAVVQVKHQARAFICVPTESAAADLSRRSPRDGCVKPAFLCEVSCLLSLLQVRHTQTLVEAASEQVRRWATALEASALTACCLMEEERREQMAGLRPVSMWKSSLSALQMAATHRLLEPATQRQQSAAKSRDLS